MKINFYKGQGILLAEINVDYQKGKVTVINHTDDNMERPFGCNEHPTIKDFEDFIEYRTIPQTRYNFKMEMRMRGIIDTSPMGIFRQYHGRTTDDDYYAEIIEEEEKEYDDRFLE